MATLKQIGDTVLDHTKRYDRESQIRKYVRWAVRHAHTLSRFTNDLEKQDLQNVLSAPAKVSTINYPANCKEFYTMRPVSGSEVVRGVDSRPIKMTKISGQQVVDHEIAGTAVNTFYALGRAVEYNCEVEVSTFRCIYFIYPDLSTDGKFTWITEQYNEELQELVMARLYDSTGDRERANKLMQNWQISAKDIVNDNSTEATD